MVPLAVLQQLSFGVPVAEEETDGLAHYFVETSHWKQLIAGDLDLVWGPKGAGKSALYSLLLANTAALEHRRTVLTAGENPRGATAFRDLLKGAAPSEAEFEELWRLYFLALLARILREWGIDTDSARAVIRRTEAAGLLPHDAGLRGLLAAARDWVAANAQPETAEASVQVDPATGLPAKAAVGISLREPTPAQKAQGAISLQASLELADRALGEAGLTVWIALDRLDVAFHGADELERHGLRALLRVYRDFRGLDNVQLKIFLRSDIRTRLLERGFVEASHLIRESSIEWTEALLTNLMARRAVATPELCDHYGVDPDTVMADYREQVQLLHRMLPTMDREDERAMGFDWVLSRCKNGLGTAMPREVIHLFEEALTRQIESLTIGQEQPERDTVFSSVVLHDALSAVSTRKLERTIYAEFPKLAPYIRLLEAHDDPIPITTLQEIWKMSEDEAIRTAEAIAAVGVLSQDRNTASYVIPPLYRPGLRTGTGESAHVD